MEEQAASLLAALKKPSTAVDTKLQLFNVLKSNIKHQRVPEAAQAPIFECIKIAISGTTSAALVSTGFSCLAHFIKRLVLQNQTALIVNQSSKLLPILLDRLGDVRESHRNAASQILSDIWPFCHVEVETLIREHAMKGNNARAKEVAMLWLVKMSRSEGLPFRSFVPLLVANLEDADPGVRETAKSAVVELFNNAPDHAKTDLKKQLINAGVRKTISTFIISHLNGGAAPEVEMPPPPATVSKARAETLQPDTGFADSMLSDQPPPVEAVSMDPLHVYTQRELEDIFRSMAPYFEGKETEANWSARDKSVLKLRRIAKGNAPTEFHAAFVAGIKSLLDGILKVANSLRTTMSTNGCQCIQDLVRTLGPATDPWLEILAQAFIKMCAATKNIAAQNGNTTVEVLFSNVSYTPRLLQHITFAVQDKNAQPRIFSAGWAKTMIKKHKGSIEHSAGLDALENIIKKGLADANPKVREAYRSTYWLFASVWPQKGEAIMNTLDARDKKLLEKDPNNPNALSAPAPAAVSSFSKSIGPGTARMSLKEKIAEQKKARLAAKGVLERPNSAQASYSPMKTQPGKATQARNPPSTGPAVTARPPSSLGGGPPTKSALSSSGNGTGSLMAGAVRRPIRPKMELVRPATADPYARRPGAKNVTPSMTPERTPARETVKKSAAPKSTVRPRAQTQQSPSVSPIRNRSKLEPTTSHRKTPSGSSRHGSPALSPSRNEDLTMVVPIGQPQRPLAASQQRLAMERTASLDNAMQDYTEEDGFTMVIPNLAQPNAQAPQRSPPKQISNRFEGEAMRSPHALAEMTKSLSLSAARSPRMRSPDHSRLQTVEAAEDVQVYEDPFDNQHHDVPSQTREKPVLEELPLNGNQANVDVNSDVIMADGVSTPRGHQKTASTGGGLYGDNNAQPKPEVLKNRQLLSSGINKIRNKTIDTHMFRRLQDMIKSNQDIWGVDDEKFGELLLASLEYLETPAEALKAPSNKAANLKVQALATIRAMLALYRRESAKYFSRVLCTILQTKAHYENTSHIAADLEATAEEIVRYGQTSDCLNSVLDLLDSPTASDVSMDSDASTASIHPNRTTTMALTTLSNLLHISSEKSIPISPEQTRRLGQMAVRFLDDTDADVRKADIEFCISLHRKIGGEKEQFWKAVAGAREQHLNLITYFLAKRGKA